MEAEKQNELMEVIHKGDTKQLLVACAEAVASNDMSTVECLISELREMVSVSGEPIQRLAAYMLEGLVARLSFSGSAIYKALWLRGTLTSTQTALSLDDAYMLERFVAGWAAMSNDMELNLKEPPNTDLFENSPLYDSFPYLKFGCMSANGAILEVMRDENHIHIIDFRIAQGSQWDTVIQALAARPDGPPHIRITGIDDPFSARYRSGELEIVGQRLSRLAKSYNVPFQFHIGATSGSQVELENLRIRPGEALAVNFAFMLHLMPDESVDTHNHRDRLLRLVKRLSPKVVTLVEHECNTNTTPFLQRFVETLSYYTAVFESFDLTAPRYQKGRINLEQHYLARDVVNILACEGNERVTRYEVLEKWRSRLKMVGFSPYPLSSYVNTHIKSLLRGYSDNYIVEERNGALYLGWMNKALVTSSAWR